MELFAFFINFFFVLLTRANGVTLNRIPTLSIKDRNLLRNRGIIRKEMPPVQKVTDSVLRKNQLLAEFVKYGLYHLRHYYITATNLLTPVLFLLMTLTSVRIIKERVIDHSLRISIAQLDMDTVTLIYSAVPNSSTSLVLEDYIKSLEHTQPNVKQHLVRFIEKEMGPFLATYASKNLDFYTRHMAMALSLDKYLNVTLWFNAQFGHSMAMGLQLIYDAFLQQKNLSLACYNNPIPVPANEVGGYCLE